MMVMEQLHYKEKHEKTWNFSTQEEKKKKGYGGKIKIQKIIKAVDKS